MFSDVVLSILTFLCMQIIIIVILKSKLIHVLDIQCFSWTIQNKLQLFYFFYFFIFECLYFQTNLIVWFQNTRYSYFLFSLFLVFDVCSFYRIVLHVASFQQPCQPRTRTQSGPQFASYWSEIPTRWKVSNHFFTSVCTNNSTQNHSVISKSFISH